MVMLYPQDARINVLAPIVRGRKGEFKKELPALRARGFTKARIDGQFRSLDEDIKLDRRRNHIDRRASSTALIVRGGIERRLLESIDVALNLADDIVVINSLEGGDRLFSRRLACVDCGLSMPGDDAARVLVQLAARRVPRLPGPRRDATISIRTASCRTRSKSLADGAIAPWARGDRKLVREALQSLSRTHRHRSHDVPFVEAAAKAARRRCSSARRQAAAGKKAFEGHACRTCAAGTRKARGRSRRSWKPYRSLRPCPACHGAAAEARRACR